MNMNRRTLIGGAGALATSSFLSRGASGSTSDGLRGMLLDLSVRKIEVNGGRDITELADAVKYSVSGPIQIPLDLDRGFMVGEFDGQFDSAVIWDADMEGPKILFFSDRAMHRIKTGLGGELTVTFSDDQRAFIADYRRKM